MNPLAPFGILYGLAMDVRNRMYDRGVLRSHALGARTISIGNLTAGGTGKTPLVALTARILAENGEKVCVLTRGYRRANENERVLVSDGETVLADAATGGDEPVELARKLIGKAVVIADADRVGAGSWAMEKFGITAFVLDDGFQHRRARRDVDIVCIDATNPYGGGVIPAGTAREPYSGLRRTDAVMITRADLVPDVSDLRSRITILAPGAAVFEARNEISGIVPLAQHRLGLQAPRASGLEATWKKLRAEGRADNPDEEVCLLAFCALGNPDSFFLLLLGKFDEDLMDEFDLSIIRAFPDHHAYTQQDIDRLEKQAKECGVDVFLTTAKDAVKLRDLRFTIPCYVVEIEPRIENEAGFREMIISS